MSAEILGDDVLGVRPTFSSNRCAAGVMGFPFDHGVPGVRVTGVKDEAAASLRLRREILSTKR